MPKTYLAIDIGASSGRHIVGWKENGEIKTSEVYRFPNGVTERDGHLIWDVGALLSHVKKCFLRDLYSRKHDALQDDGGKSHDHRIAGDAGRHRAGRLDRDLRSDACRRGAPDRAGLGTMS